MVNAVGVTEVHSESLVLFVTDNSYHDILGDCNCIAYFKIMAGGGYYSGESYIMLINVCISFVSG